MIEMTHEEIERIWNSFSHYIPDRQKSDAAVDFVNTLNKQFNISKTNVFGDNSSHIKPHTSKINLP